MSEQLLNHYSANARSWVVVVALMAGDLSEGQACKLCRMSRVEMRELVQESQVVAGLLWARFRNTGETVATDLADEAARKSMNRCRCSD